MLKRIPAPLLLCSALLFAQKDPTQKEVFIEKPYVQLGDSPKLAGSESLILMWHTANEPAEWAVEIRTSKDSAWRTAERPIVETVNVPTIPAHLVYRARLTNLVPGELFRYRVLKSGNPVFEAEANARKSAAQPFRFVLFGDCAQGSAAQKAVAYQTSLAKPDFVFIPGDIVYGAGRISEYRDRFFPVYNSDRAAADAGAPLIRSIPFIAAPGNHDTALQNFARFPDALAYFFYWDQPLNGPVPPSGADKVKHTLTGNVDAQPAFLSAAEARYPKMANFSFDYGNAHWVVLDSNPYMDWTNPALRDWIATDLANARSAAWRFVAFHHPGFNSSKAHFTDQWMRLLAPVFETGNVDIVFAGHVHNYQRSFPLTFVAKPQADGKTMGPKGEVAGDWKLDKSFADGSTVTKPHGVIYIISGGGGASLYDPDQQSNPASWQSFTDKFISTVHSLSVVDIDGKKFHLTQISDEGKELDSFRITK